MARSRSYFMIGADAKDFPKVVLVRAEPAPWQKVLCPAIKRITTELAKQKVCWRDIFIWPAPSGSGPGGAFTDDDWEAWQKRRLENPNPDITTIVIESNGEHRIVK